MNKTSHDIFFFEIYEYYYDNFQRERERRESSMVETGKEWVLTWLGTRLLTLIWYFILVFWVGDRNIYRMTSYVGFFFFLMLFHQRVFLFKATMLLQYLYTVYQRISLFIYSENLVRHFAFFFFFFLSNSSYSTRRHCSYRSYIFFVSRLYFFFSFIYIIILIQQILQYFHNYWGINFL